MPLKDDWVSGEQWTADDANDVAGAVNAAYVKPGDGIPKADLVSAVQVSLGKADTAVQAVDAATISDSTSTGRAVLKAADAAAARTAIGVAYGTTSGTVVQGNDSRLTPNAAAITDSTATGRAVLKATDASTARSVLGVAYGTTSGTVVQGNDSRITGAQQGRVIATVPSGSTLSSAARTDHVVLSSGTNSAVSAPHPDLTLPTAVGNTNLYMIKNTSDYYDLSVNTTSGQNIYSETWGTNRTNPNYRQNSASSLSVSASSVVRLVSNGSDWITV